MQAMVGHDVLLDRAVVATGGPRFLLTTIQVDGVVRYRWPILKEMLRRGWDVHVAAPDVEALEQLACEGVHTYPIAVDRGGVNPVREYQTLQNFRRVARLVNPRLSHHFSTKAVIYGCLSTTGVNVATITGLGHSLSGTGSRLARGPVRIASKTLYRSALKRCDRVIFQNENDRETFVHKRIAHVDRTQVIQGSGIDMDYFHPSRRRATNRPFRFVMLSRMLVTKGVVDFAKAASMVLSRSSVPCEFVLAGPLDKENPGCVEESQIRSWERDGVVRWIGSVRDGVEAYAEADAVVLPSYYNEGLSRSLVEGAAMGLPVITTDNPGCREVVDPDASGLVVPIRQPEKLAEAMTLLAENRALAQIMGSRGRSHVERRFSLSSVLEQTLHAYDRVLTDGGLAGLD